MMSVTSNWMVYSMVNCSCPCSRIVSNQIEDFEVSRVALVVVVVASFFGGM